MTAIDMIQRMGECDSWNWRDASSTEIYHYVGVVETTRTLCDSAVQLPVEWRFIPHKQLWLKVEHIYANINFIITYDFFLYVCHTFIYVYMEHLFLGGGASFALIGQWQRKTGHGGEREGHDIFFFFYQHDQVAQICTGILGEWCSVGRSNLSWGCHLLHLRPLQSRLRCTTVQQNIVYCSASSWLFNSSSLRAGNFPHS